VADISAWATARGGLEFAMPVSGTALLVVAWRLYRIERQTGALVVLLAAGLLFRLSAAGDWYLHEWDERYHALVAKHLIEKPFRPVLYADPVLDYDYRDWTANHVWLHKPPLALWLMALSMKLFGVNEFAARLPSVILSTVGVYLTFCTGRLLFDPAVGLIAAALQVMNGLLLDLAAGRRPTDHVDTVLLFFVSLGGYAVALDQVRPRWRAVVLIGLCTGCAYLTKSYIALLIPGLWVAALVGTEQPKGALGARFLAMLALATALVVPWRIHVTSHFAPEAAWESGYVLRHLRESLEGHMSPWFSYLARIGRDFGELSYVPLLWFIASPRSRWQGAGERLLLVWLLLPLLVFSAAATKLPGYLAVSAPAIFLIVALFMCRAGAWVGDPQVTAVSRRLLVALLALLLLLPLRYTGERLLVAPSPDRDPVWAQRLRVLDACVGPGNAVLFNAKRPIEAMFYGEHPAYAAMPDAATIGRLASRGVRVVILGSSDHHEARELDRGVEILEPVPLAAGGWYPCRGEP
jgi:4-amino-4-deoxy-L-arabinose transferase-like glycosyltransferase